MVGCSYHVGIATQAGSIGTQNGDTLNRTPLADMWLIHHLASRVVHKITVRSSGWTWRDPGSTDPVVVNER